MAPLFTIETPRLRLTWSGPTASRRGAHPLAARVLGAETVALDHADVWLEEETGYPVLLQSLDGSPVSLRHRDPVVTAGLVAVDGGRVVHGRVRFGSQAGRARFVVWAGDEPQVEVNVSVLPTKLSEAEVTTMRAELEAAAVGLSVAVLRPTALSDAGGPSAPSVSVWLASLRAALDPLAHAVSEIERRPNLALVRPLGDVRPSRIGRPAPETRQSAARRGLDVATLPARPGRLSLDTPAHRWLAACLARAEHRLWALAREEAGRAPTDRRRALAGELSSMASRLERLRETPVLRGAPGRAPSVPPLVLRRRPAYAQAFDALRQLDQGLGLRDGALDVATQDLAVVYETWAALTVVRTAAEVLGVEPPIRPFGVEALGSDIRLQRGRRHSVVMESRDVRLEVVYNPRFPAPPALLAQRPDLVLLTTRAGQTRRVILDAKYRRDDSAGYLRRHGAAGPPEDALGTLHRYRDAISGGGPPVAVAAALFPGTFDDAFAGSRLWTSLDALGVGAIPLRPDHTAALAAFIGGLVG